MIVWRDGEMVSAEAAVSAEDRGYLVGDAVFETMLVEGGQAAFLRPHLARLTLGCATLRMEFAPDEARIRRAILDLAEIAPLKTRAACRITVSRLGGPRGVAPGEGARVRMIIALNAAPLRSAPLSLIVSAHKRSAAAATNGFKCAGAYAQNMLARMEAIEAGADEAIMLNEYGRVACASSANVFVMTDRGIATPPPREGAMPGVVREIVLEETHKLGLAAEELEIEPAALASAPLLLTNSVIGVAVGAVGDYKTCDRDAVAHAIINAYERRLAAALPSRLRGAPS